MPLLMHTNYASSQMITMKKIISVLPAKGLLVAGIYSIFLCSTSNAQLIEGVDYSDRKNVDKTFDMAGTDIFGQRFPSESLTITDPVTGVKIIALTTSRHNSSKIYQDHPNWTADGKYIVFTSNRNTTAGGNVTFADPRARGG